MRALSPLQTILPTRAIALLMAIGFTDLASTWWLHKEGRIVEMNPLMRGFIEHSEVSFGLVKGMTLVLAWFALASYARTNVAFVRRACMIGSGTYLFVWGTWFLAGR